jgi:hypothetical protein
MRTCILLPLAIATLALPSPADVIRVPTDASLQAAIDQAQDADVIEIAAGTYLAPAGGFRISNKQAGFTLRAAPGATVILDGNGTRDVLRFQNSSVALGGLVHFEGITFRNGFTNTAGLSGGVTVQRGQAIFSDCRFEGNVNANGQTSGGAVQVSIDSTATFERCVFEDNIADTTGGGLSVATRSTVTVRDSRFRANRTNPPGHHPNFSGGGAIHVGNSTLEVIRTRFEDNESGFAGGALFAIGSWDDAQGGSHVVVDNCTFESNRARRNQPAFASFFPTEGGALHAEDLAEVVIRDSRFFDNEAMDGGGVNLYRADVTIEESVFRGNRATGADAIGDKSKGGAISVISNDANDATTGFGASNRRPGRLTLRRSLLQGRYGATTTAADVGGCLFASGDTNRLFGVGGVPANGTLEENQARILLEGVVFHDCDAQQTAIGGSGFGGAILASASALALSGSLVIDSDAGSGGGGIAILAYSDLAIEDTVLAANTAGSFGGALFVQGAHVEVRESSFLGNEVSPGLAEACFPSLGAAIFAAQFQDNSGSLADSDATGFVADSLFSSQIGLAVFDDDRKPGPINDLRYAGNQFFESHFSGAVYTNALNPPPAICVPGATLSAHVVTRDAGPSTPKGTLPGGPPSPANVDLGDLPAFAALIAAPTRTLAEPGEAPAFLGQAWLGAATLNGIPLSGSTGLAPVLAGTYTLATEGVEQTILVPEPSATASGLAVAIACGWRALRRRGRAPHEGGHRIAC